MTHAEQAIAVLMAGQIGEGLFTVGEQSKLHSIARHEAAHVIAGCCVGRFPLRAWISEQGGEVEWPDPAPGDSSGNRSDSEKIASIQNIMASTDEPVDLAKVKVEVRTILRDHWTAVWFIAENLLVKRQLTGSEMRDILKTVAPEISWPE